MEFTAEAMRDVDFDADLNSTAYEIPYNHAQLQIVSLNRENANGTWSGRLSSAIGDALLKIEIDEGVDLERLTRDEYVFVDAVVTYRQDINSASLIPQSILVTDVHDDDSHNYADDTLETIGKAPR